MLLVRMTVLLLATFATFAYAPPAANAAQQSYMSMKGKKQGQVKGPATKKGGTSGRPVKSKSLTPLKSLKRTK